MGFLLVKNLRLGQNGVVAVILPLQIGDQVGFGNCGSTGEDEGLAHWLALDLLFGVNLQDRRLRLAQF